MLQVNCIGHLGGDAELKNANGKEFTTFRIAHSERWTDDSGQQHEYTTWVDCIINGKPGVFEYLKRGQQVFVSGGCSLRVYSSAKDRCMKAGLTINVRSVELLGTKVDTVPSQLINPADGSIHNVVKYYLIPDFVDNLNSEGLTPLQSRNGGNFVVNGKGWVFPDNNNEG